MPSIDVAIIGAGVVGLAVAERLSRSGRDVVVLERHSRHGVETSSRNSEVVHSGIYYPKNSLKATLCLQGSAALYALGERHGFFIRRTGKLVVAVKDAEIPKLESLQGRGRDNGVQGLELLDPSAVRRLAPGVEAVAALWCPSSGIVDSEELMGCFRGKAEEGGAIFLWSSPLEKVERAGGRYRLWIKGQDEPIEASRVVNAAGLHSDAVAAMAGVDCDAAGYRLHYFKGEYFRLRKKLEIKPLVYPIPGAHGLGIHLTVNRQGVSRLGPNAFPVEALDYEIDASHRPSFLEAAAAYLPGLALEDLEPDTTGIRPKLSRDGSFRDFVIAEESPRGLPGWVNCIGIESPGLTASPAIAERVAELLR